MQRIQMNGRYRQDMKDIGLNLHPSGLLKNTFLQILISAQVQLMKVPIHCIDMEALLIISPPSTFQWRIVLMKKVHQEYILRIVRRERRQR